MRWGLEGEKREVECGKRLLPHSHQASSDVTVKGGEAKPISLPAHPLPLHPPDARPHHHPDRAEVPVPAELMGEVETRRSELVERVAEVDEAVGELFVMEQPVDGPTLRQAVRRCGGGSGDGSSPRR